MKTKELIKSNAIKLFNEKGIKNVTLRDIAKKLNKSYGNITYHFKTKEHLLIEIYEDYNLKLEKLGSENFTGSNLLEFFLKLPGINFEIMIEYLFFFIDYIEIKRAYPDFINQVEITNNIRKKKWFNLLQGLQRDGFLKKTLSEEELLFIMELSAGIRLFYFQENLGRPYDKVSFVKKINLLLFPYLTEKGQKIYKAQ